MARCSILYHLLTENLTRLTTLWMHFEAQEVISCLPFMAIVDSQNIFCIFAKASQYALWGKLIQKDERHKIIFALSSTTNFRTRNEPFEHIKEALKHLNYLWINPSSSVFLNQLARIVAQVIESFFSKIQYSQKSLPADLILQRKTSSMLCKKKKVRTKLVATFLTVWKYP